MPTAAPQNSAPPDDLVIVGAGIAGTSALLELLEHHREGRTGRERLRVTVVERSEDLYAGLPYGERSGSASLIVTGLDEFLTDALRDEFRDWLRAHREQILAAGPDLGISTGWVSDHAEDLREDRLEHLYLPRRLFGRFLAEHTRARIAATPGAEVATVRGEARALDRAEDGGWRLTVRTEDGAVEVEARSVLLALGSPPKQTLPHSIGPGSTGVFVEDSHAESMDALIEQLRETLSGLPDGASRDLLVVGASADALELLHSLHRAEDLEPRLGALRVLTPRGTPNTWTIRPDRREEYRSIHLAAYAAEGPETELTAAGMLQAVAADVEAALAEGYAEQDTVPELKRLAGGLLDRLSWEEQQSYVTREGNLINRYSRPTGGDYQRVADRWLREGRLEVIPGRYAAAAGTPEGWQVTVRADEQEAPLPDRYAVVVNCAGFQTLDDTDDPFLRALLDQELVTANASRGGLAVDAHHRAAPGVFVAGPLLAGNLNETLRVWHLESCQRILGMAPALGADLAAAVAAQEPAGA